jgi:hypothetical protein
MMEMPAEWEKHIQDKDYFLQIWNPKFVEVEGLIILEAHYDPMGLHDWISRSRGNYEKLENTLNHVHLDYITEEVDLQEEIGQNLRIRWRQTLQQIFPDRNFEINLVLVNNKDWELQLWTKRT